MFSSLGGLFISSLLTELQLQFVIAELKYFDKVSSAIYDITIFLSDYYQTSLLTEN